MENKERRGKERREEKERNSCLASFFISSTCRSHLPFVFYFVCAPGAWSANEREDTEDEPKGSLHSNLTGNERRGHD